MRNVVKPGVNCPANPLRAVSVSGRVLAEAGKVSSPPQDWLPDNPRHRSLVQTGDLSAGN